MCGNYRIWLSLRLQVITLKSHYLPVNLQVPVFFYMFSYAYYLVIKFFFGFLSYLFQLFVRIVYPQPTTPPAPTGKPLQVIIDFEKPLTEVSDKYLSFAVDTSKALGGYWWGSSGVIEIGKGKERTNPLDFTNEKLIKLTTALAPAYLRIGGTEADNVIFDSTTEDDSIRVITKQRWDTINNFVQKNRNPFVFHSQCWSTGKGQRSQLE